MIKRIAPLLVLLIIVVVIWIGSSIYFKTYEVNINPNAEAMMESIDPTFQLDSFNRLVEKKENLPVQPEVFHALDRDNNGSTSSGSNSENNQ